MIPKPVPQPPDHRCRDRRRRRCCGLRAAAESGNDRRPLTPISSSVVQGSSTAIENNCETQAAFPRYCAQSAEAVVEVVEKGQPTTSNGGALPFITNHFISALEPLYYGVPIHRS